jgi:uncharacterized protein YacL
MLASLLSFTKATDYLSLINAAIITDLVVILFVILGKIRSKTLKEWYNKYGLSSVMADVLSIVIGVIIAQAIYSVFFAKFNIFLFILVAVIVQLIHDLLFAQFFNLIPRGKSAIMDTFKDYAKELGPIILVADASMIISTVFISSILISFSEKTNAILTIVLLYLIPYFLYSIS